MSGHFGDNNRGIVHTVAIGYKSLKVIGYWTVFDLVISELDDEISSEFVVSETIDADCGIAVEECCTVDVASSSVGVNSSAL